MAINYPATDRRVPPSTYQFWLARKVIASILPVCCMNALAVLACIVIAPFGLHLPR